MAAPARLDLVSSQWTKLKKAAKEQLPWVCIRCNRPIPTDVPRNHPLEVTLDHLKPHALYPDHKPTLADVGLAHRSCNASHGARLGNAMRGGHLVAVEKAALTDLPDPDPSSPVDFIDVPWVAALLRRMPATAVWPRIMTGPHPAATGSYGPAIIGRIEARRDADPGIPDDEKQLRWFQKLLITRAYEHDADGRLVWETVLQTSNRQVGKSVGVREVCLDRMLHGHGMFGEHQLVLHAARDLSVAEEVQLPARQWARWRQGQGDPLKAIDTNGKTAIECDGGRWLVRSDRALYGFSASMGMVDECWDVKRSAVSAGIQKTMAARQQPQMWLLSTAHADATDLFPWWRAKAIVEVATPRKTLILEWSAPREALDTDETAWRAASPYWDEHRRALIAEDVGNVDFREQWLNIWPAYGATRAPAAWLDIGAYEVSEFHPGRPLVGAIESQSEAMPNWSAALAWVDGDGLVRVRVERAGDLATALALMNKANPDKVVMHRYTRNQVAGLPPWHIVLVSQAELVAATGVFRDKTVAGRLRWTGDTLARDMQRVVTTPSVAGHYLDQHRSPGPISAVKAAAYAVWAAVTTPDEAPAIY